MGMFGGEGSWWLRSQKDSRWNINGRGFIVVSIGMHSDAAKFIECKKEELGCDPPDDLEYGCMKD